jgi:hypothetical protein
VEIQQFPRGFQDSVDTVTGIIDEISEDDSQALESVLFHVEEGFWVGLDYLLE